MSVLISGSIAYDNILSYGSRFSDHLIPGSLDHINLSFVTDNMIRGYGGCAANIAYSIKMLGGDPLVIGAVGTDGRDYQVYFEMHGIDTALVKLNDTFTAQCFTTTDITGAQITAFNPGAMLRSHEAPFPEDRKIELAIVGPDGKQAMQQRSRELAIRKIPFIFDIGQGAPLFNGEEMKEMLYLADYAVASDYEADLMTRATGLTVDQIASGLKAFIITHGEKGSTVYYDGKTLDVPAVKSNAVDPVGAGDAYRGGLLYGLTHGYDWQQTLRLASVMGSFKVESAGAQAYKATKEEIAAKYEKAYGEKIEL